MTDQQQAQAANSTKQRAFDLQKVGSYIDGWGDLVEDMGGKEEEVRQEILKQLQERNMPEVDLEIMQGHVGLGRERRPFVVATINPAVSVLISVRKYGKDLYVGWRSSMATKWNSELLKWAAIIAGGLGLFMFGIRRSNSFFGPSGTSFSLTGWIGGTLGIIIVEAILLVLAGKYLRGDNFAFFIQPVNLFDAEHISALGLSVHQFVLRSLDNTGIDVSKLRIKQKFSGGRKGEDL